MPSRPPPHNETGRRITHEENIDCFGFGVLTAGDGAKCSGTHDNSSGAAGICEFAQKPRHCGCKAGAGISS